MKKIITAIALFSLSTTMALAYPSLDDQISVTKDTIARLSADLHTRNSAGGLRLSDYRVWEQEFKKNMDKHFEAFEKELTEEVYAPLKDITSKLEQVRDDKSLKYHQRNMLYASLESSLKAMIPGITHKYQNILRKLYHSHNHTPTAVQQRGMEVFKFNKKGKPVGRFGKTAYTHEKRKIFSKYPDGKLSKNFFQLDTRNGIFPNRNINFNLYNDGSLFNYNYLIESYIYPPYISTHERIIEGCRSKSCIHIKTSDIIQWYQSIRKLDEHIRIVSPSGKNIVISSLSQIQEPGWSYIMSGDYFKRHVEVLKRADLPSHLENLPFDI